MMEWFNILTARLRALFRRESVLRDIEEELRVHVEMETEMNIERGMAPDQARAAALKSFGALGRHTELGYDIRGGGWLEALWQDLRYGMRMMLKNPGFTTIAVLTLALGIGANTAIFTLFNAATLQPLAVKEPDSLVRLYTRRQGDDDYHTFSSPDYIDFRGVNNIFTELIAFGTFRTGLTVGTTEANEEAQVGGLLVSGNYFTTLGVKALIGRTLGLEDDRTPGAHPLVVLGHDFWQRAFGGDAAAVGKTIYLNHQPFSIVGVLPRDFHGTEIVVPDLFAPLTMQDILQSDRGLSQMRGIQWLNVIGRLKPGIKPEQAQAALNLRAEQISQAEARPDGKISVAVTAATLLSPSAQNLAVPIASLALIATGLVLLIACANVANLTLARAATRQKELAVRLALGAGRGRLVQQLLTESVLLALLGGVMGLVVARWCAALLLYVLHAPGEQAPYLNITPDWRVFSYSLSLSLLTGVAFGLAPALQQATNLDLTSAFKAGGATSGQPIRRSRLRSLLVVLQVAVSLMLLSGAGLLVRNLQRTETVDPGFETNKVIALSFNLQTHGYDNARAAVFQRRLTERLANLPGVASVGWALKVPLGRDMASTSVKTENAQSHPGDSATRIAANFISSGYFETLRIPILQGQDFSGQEEQAHNSAIINEAAALRLWPGEDPIGKRLYLGADMLRVIGVVRNTRSVYLGEEGLPILYLPLRSNLTTDLKILVRTTSAPQPLMAIAPNVVREIDPNIQCNSRRLSDNLETWIAPARLGAGLSSALGILALLLAAIGVYGVMAFLVGQRTHEIGIRLALGAERSDVLKLVIRQGMKLVATGIVFGLAGSAVLMQALARYLFVGLSATDPVAFVGVSLLLGLVTLAACYIPARHAIQIDPLVTLRHE
jgi:macrolide transport system ATP-binding/permease protein